MYVANVSNLNRRKNAIKATFICFQNYEANLPMLKIDIIDGKNTKKAKDLWLRIWPFHSNSAQDPIREVKMDDFITYKNFGFNIVWII